MAKATHNRRTTTAGYTRGEDTRARVLASALRLFGLYGFEGTSTRDIAVDAGVNTPAVHYYFAGKEGLYLACVEHIVARLWSHVGTAAARAESLLEKRASHAALIDAYCAIQECMADFMFGSPEPSGWLLIVVREQAGLGPDAGFRLMYREVTVRLLKIHTSVVGRLLRLPLDADETRVRAVALNGQLLMFMFMRRSLLTTLGWDGFGGERVEFIKRCIRENTEAVLKAMLDTGRRSKKKSSPRNRT
jgi:AcrR family transcriptional regulator